MAFPTKLLNEGEEIVLDLRPHWARLVGPELLVAVLVVAAGVTLGLRVPVAPVVAGIALVPAVLYLLFVYVKWTTTNFVVTTDRLIHREGVVSKQGIEIPLDRVQTIKFHQSPFERMMGAGDLMIESAGETGQNTFTDIRKPGVVQNEIWKQMEANEVRTAKKLHRAVGGAGAGISVAEQLEKLQALQQQGALTPAEFAAEKAKLLGG